MSFKEIFFGKQKEGEKLPKAEELKPSDLITPRASDSSKYKPYGERANELTPDSKVVMANWGSGDNSQSGTREAYAEMNKNQKPRSPDLDAIEIKLSTGTDDKMEITRPGDKDYFQQTGS